MNKYITAAIMLLIVVLVSLVLSGYGFESVDNLMRPPKIEGENSEIQAAFEKSVDDKYRLISPLSGNYRSSFILVDLNDDGDNEVVVFYSTSTVSEIIRMNILDEINGEWNSIVDIESSHSDVHRVDFSDLDNDGKKELIIGWSLLDQELSNTLNVYKLNLGNSEQIIENVFTKEYTDYMICDVNGDDKSDVIIFENSVTDQYGGIKATYLDFKVDKVYAAGEFNLDPIISAITSISYDNASADGNKRFYIDGYKTDSGMTTDVFYWDNSDNVFSRIQTDSAVSVTSSAVRLFNVACSDINDDSVIEIPFEYELEKSEIISSANQENKQQHIIGWMQITDNSYEVVNYEIYNNSNGYILNINKESFGKFTVKNNLDTGVMTFYELFEIKGPEDGEAKPKKKKDENQPPKENPDRDVKPREEEQILQYEVGEELFSILTTKESYNNFYELSDYRFIKSDNGYSYYCRIYENGKNKGITKETIKQILITRR